MTRNYPYFPEQDDERLLDEAIDRLQRGDRSGLERLDPETAQSVEYMVGLARDAGWTRGNLEGVPASRLRLAWLPPLRSLVAAVLVVMLIGSMGLLGWRVIEDDLWPGREQAQSDIAQEQEPGGEFASTDVVVPGAGVCDREPRTAEEIARIVKGPSTPWDPSAKGDRRPDAEINASLVQYTEDWNVCLISGQYDRAMAYESEDFLRAMAAASDVHDDGNLTDEQIATAVANRHRNLQAMASGEGVHVSIYGWSFMGSNGISKAEMKMVPVDPKGDWVEWPTAITFVYEDGQWVIQLTDRPGSPSDGRDSESSTAIEAHDIRFSTDQLIVRPGDTISFTNVGALEHDFVVDDLGLKEVADPGGEAVMITIPKDAEPGNYEFYCSIAGHREAGMVGTLTVDAP